MTAYEYFKEITQIPRPSKHEEKITEYMISKAKSFGYEYKLDEIGNLKITIGSTNSETVVLQGHLDMVCEKTPETEIDFLNDGLNIYEEDGFLRAKGTTLGADNGVALAYGLALMDSYANSDADHPTIELLFTTDEETGLTGATNLDPKLISGKKLINLDSEEHGCVYVGCAGGASVEGELFVTRKLTAFGSEALGESKEKSSKLFNGNFFRIALDGLSGGHSGGDIHLNRINAIKLFGKVLMALAPVFIVDINCGDKHNVIPRDGVLNIGTMLDEDMVNKIIAGVVKNLDNQNGETVNFKVQKVMPPPFHICRDDSDRIIAVLNELPHGVISLSQDFDGVVESSTNLASIKTVKNKVIITTSQRSLDNSKLSPLSKSISNALAAVDFKVAQTDKYPGWLPNKDSALLDVAKASFKKLLGKDPEVTAIHAGLECGVISDKIDGLDIISIGPEMFDVHTPAERLNIESFNKTYEILNDIIKNC